MVLRLGAHMSLPILGFLRVHAETAKGELTWRELVDVQRGLGPERFRLALAQSVDLTEKMNTSFSWRRRMGVCV